ncbi:beta-class carbonic anhydrase [Leifsonia sp. RAF41]|uniref:beta-class carbonic anhydrase n=1 Tax=Leifsonia sp. RAF41 TaxID=3233056 RepID=UPI003F9DA637
MPLFDPFVQKNALFAESGAFRDKPIYPAREICVLTCLDPRTDPAAFLGLGLGDAAILRNAGGRVNQSVIDDLALITFLADVKLRPGTGPLFEVAVIHHTDCGTKPLADPQFRSSFAARTGFDQAELIQEAVVDPFATVAHDVERLLRSNLISPRISVSGHVYDVATGLVSTVIPSTRMPAATDARPNEEQL